MVANTPKWHLTVEEAGDAADMPAASARSAASIEAALDQLQTNTNNLLGTKFDKAGGTITGAVRVNGSIEQNSWGYTYDGNNTWQLVRRSPNLTQVLSFPITIRYSDGLTTFAHLASFAGGMQVADAAMPVDNTPAGDTNRHWLVYDQTGRVEQMPDLVFRSYVVVAAGASSRRWKTSIGAPKSVPDVRRLQPRAFTWTDEARAVTNPGERFGLIAEEVAAVDERLVIRDQDGQVAGLDHSALIAALVAEVQELRARLDALA